MEKAKEYSSDINNDIFEDDEDLRDYINLKCMKAINSCNEYIEKEYSNDYDEDELTIVREKMCMKTGIAIGMQLSLTIQKYSKKI